MTLTDGKITSLNGRALQDCHWTPDVRDGHLPIHPCEPHPENKKLLFLQPNQELIKKSYVKTLKKLTIPLICLREHYGRHGLICSFTSTSYKELVESARYQPSLSTPNRSGFTHPIKRREVQPAYLDTFISTEPSSTRTGANRATQRTEHDYTRSIVGHRGHSESRPFLPDSVDYERRIRFNAAAQARNYGTMYPPNTNSNSRSNPRSSTSYRALPPDDVSRDRCASVGGILKCVVFICVCVWLLYAVLRGSPKNA